MLRLTGMWEKTNAKGGRYFVGRLGAAKVVLLENRERRADNDPSHILFLADGGDLGRPREAR
jgi:hypothetical protein